MRLRKTHVFLWVACLMALCAPVQAESDAATAQLEINQHRFSRHAGGYDRLVLEFTRKDSNPVAPQIHADQNATGGWNISVENATLLGAIPESMINDSFKNKSRFLGEVSVNADSPRGFTVTANLKSGRGKHIESFWLDAPARLVIDSYGSVGHVAEKRESASVAVAPGQKPVIEREAKFPGFAHLICFPATSRVGLTVVFQPEATEGDQMQNYRINTDGIGGSTQPSADAINCYPKKSQIKAALSYEDHKPAAFQSQGKTFFTPLPPGFSGATGGVSPLAAITPSPLPGVGSARPLAALPPGITPPPIGQAPMPSAGMALAPTSPSAPTNLLPFSTPTVPGAKPPTLAMPSNLSSLMGKAPLSPLPTPSATPMPSGITPAPPLRANSSLGLPGAPGLPANLIPAPKADISDLDLDPGPLSGTTPAPNGAAPVPPLPGN